MRIFFSNTFHVHLIDQKHELIEVNVDYDICAYMHMWIVYASKLPGNCTAQTLTIERLCITTEMFRLGNNVL